MKTIAVVGSGHFEGYVHQIRSNATFPEIHLIFIDDYYQLPEAERIERMREALEQSKPDAMVLGPYDHKNLMPYTNLPCYVVHPTIQDFLLLHPYIQDYERTAVVLSKRDVIDLPALEGCLNIRYNLFSYRSQAEIPGIVQDLKKQGFHAVVSNASVVDLAQQEGMDGFYYFNCKTIEYGIQNVLQVIENLEQEQRYIYEIRSILDNASCGAIYFSGTSPVVSFINQTALNILRRKSGDFIRQPLARNFPKNIQEMILGCYEPVNNVQFSLCGVDIIANIVPIEAVERTKNICILFEKTDNILKRESLIRQGLRRRSFNTRYTFQDIKGKSAALQNAIAQAKRFAETDSTIFIHAETGAGKEVFAQSIHNHSTRREYPFIAINCASIPDTLIESELFGYTSGSFTGASNKGKQGLIELANHGTVFLDDVDGLSYSFQSKLLRVIQEREIIRIGGDASIPVDVRFIVATNRDLRRMVEEGKFRNDLYFRINVLNLKIPPLRTRPEDIPELYRHYLGIYDFDLYEKIKDNIPEIFQAAFSYSYPGNVRELINVVERFKSLAEPNRVGDLEYLRGLVEECLDIQTAEFPIEEDIIQLTVSGNYGEDIRQAEGKILQCYLERSNGNMSQLAKQLNISRATLYHKLRNLDITQS